MARQRGGHLSLTFTLRSALSETTNVDEKDAVEELDEMEDWLVNYQDISMSIERREAGNTGLNTTLRVLRERS